MNLLAIDTSTDIASLALKVKDRYFNKEQSSVKIHAKVLLPLIDDLLDQAGISVCELDAIVFGRGPGSFTGLRIACSMAKGLAYAADIPLIPVSTLSAIVFEARRLCPGAGILAVLDARMQELYWGFYPPGKWQSEEYVSPADRIWNALLLETVENSNCLLAGVGFEPYYDQFSDRLKEKISESLILYPKALAMIALAEAGYFPKISAAEAAPVYIRNKVTQGDV